MFNKTVKSFQKFVRVVAVAGAVLGALGGAAHAAQCVPSIVDYSPNTLLIQCSPNNYFAYTTAQGSCAVQTIDTIKMWSSLAQAALLSGKLLNIYTSTCGSPARSQITTIDLLR